MDSGTPPLMSLAGQVVLLTLNVTLDVQRFGRTNKWNDFLMRYLLNRCSTTCSIPSLELCNTQSGKGLSSIVTPLVVFPTWPTRRWCPWPTFGLERFLLCFLGGLGPLELLLLRSLLLCCSTFQRGSLLLFSQVGSSLSPKRIARYCHKRHPYPKPVTSRSTLWPPLGISKTGMWFKTT